MAVLQNAFKINKSGIILKSVHRHDFYAHPGAPEWHIDGGREYLKMSYPEGIDFNRAVTFLGLTDESTDEEIYTKAVWGFSNKSLGIVEYKLVSELSITQLNKIIKLNKKTPIADYIYKAVEYWKNIKSNES